MASLCITTGITEKLARHSEALRTTYLQQNYIPPIEGGRRILFPVRDDFGANIGTAPAGAEKRRTRMEALRETWHQGKESSTASLANDLAEELPALAVGTVAAVVLAVILTIGILFTLGLLLDCRQQRVLERRPRQPRWRRTDDEETGFANSMQPTGLTPVPAAVLASAGRAS